MYEIIGVIVGFLFSLGSTYFAGRYKTRYEVEKDKSESVEEANEIRNRLNSDRKFRARYERLFKNDR